jgi:hypothetical protein
MVDAPLHVLYLKQLSILREKSIKLFQQLLAKDGNEFEALLQVSPTFL